MSVIEGNSAVASDRPPSEHRPVAQESRRVRWLSALVARGTAVPAVISLLIVAIFFQTQSKYFLSPINLANLAVQVTLIAAIALGEVVVLLLGEIDLSLGSVSGVAAAVLAVLVTSDRMPWLAAIIITLACGAAMGAFQGIWIAWLRIPSFVVTLAGFLGFMGVQLAVLGPQGTISIQDPNIAALTGTNLPKTFGWILAGVVVVAVLTTTLLQMNQLGGPHRSWKVKIRVFGSAALVSGLIVGVVAVLNLAQGIPTALLVLLGFLMLGWWITQHTRVGRHLFAVGGNTEAARRAGIPVKRIRFMAFVVAGTLAALAGVLAASYDGSSGTLTGGGTLLLEAIGAAVIGGTSLFGGEGTVWAALFGSLILGGVSNGLDLTDHSTQLKYMVEGVIVLLAVSVDTILRRRRSGGRHLGTADA